MYWRVTGKVVGPLTVLIIAFVFIVNSNAGGIPLKQNSTIVLYFYNAKWEQVPVTRRINGDITPKLLVDELLKGPKSTDSLMFSFPQGTKLLGLEIKEGIAFVNFSEEINKNYTSDVRSEWLDSVVFTLLNIPGIQGVQFLVDGKVQDVYGDDGIWIGSPRLRNDYYINEARESSGNMVLGNIYVSEQIGKRFYLVPHTLAIKRKDGSQDLQILLNTLFGYYEMRNLHFALKSWKLEGDTVILNLDSKILSFPDQEGRSLNDTISAVKYTVSEIDGVKFLKILVDGITIPSRLGIEPIQEVPENLGDLYVLPTGINPE